MPWYLVEASHGPGHQSHTSEMRWLEHELSDKEQRELWDDVFEGHDWPVGTVIKLVGLTQENQKRMKLLHQYKIEYAQQMLNVLNETPIIPHTLVKGKENLCVCGERTYICTRCCQVFCYGFIPDNGWCPDCSKCGEGKHDWSKKPPIVCMECGVEHPYEKNWRRHRIKEGKNDSVD